ncbi:MAG: ABC transporter permease [Deltaproteobacteria bacterium]|nr:ABC transporter permease [Deltaproteobacteria bacterium]MCB9785640.1 ABC transporter permease [Deltaproteobacteria bacterium]
MWRLAWRNLWRSRTRTLITGSAIALSLALQLISYGAADAMYRQMVSSAARTAGGHVLVHAKGYWERQTSDLVIPDAQPLLETIRQVPGVRVALPRVIVNGLISSSRDNAGVRLTGVDPEQERAVQDLSRYVTEGTFLGPEDPRPLVLGKRAAKDLGLKLGDRVVLTATDADGEMVRALFHLTGVLDTGSNALDSAAAWTTLDAARAAIGLDSGLTQIGVIADSDSARGAVRDRIREALGPRASDLELLTWDEAMPELVGFIEIDSSMNELFGFVIFLIVVFGIANTFLMAVMERIRELGLLAAIGLDPLRIAGLVLRETLLLALLAITVGLGLGYAGHSYLSIVGIDLAAFSQTDLEVSGVILEDMVIRSHLDPARWAIACVVVFALVLLSALYPAWRATRVDPVVAMRTYA